MFMHLQEINLLELLSRQVQNIPQKTAYTFLEDGELENSISLSYQQLHLQVIGVAKQIQSLVKPGERVLLLYPSGLDFIAVFLGCLCAEVVAVPAFPPRRNNRLERLAALAKDAQPSLVLTTPELLKLVQSQLKELELENISCLAITLSPQPQTIDWQPRNIQPDSLAYLQYTSGSTGKPKGVMISHRNIIYNLQMLKQAFQHDETTVLAGWQPVFHDMGLILNIFQPLYLGVPCILMSPTAFVQKPIRWLQAISHYRVTTTGGPNFAYDLCVDRIVSEPKAALDLSSWKVAFNGAEPIRAETLQRFSDAFAQYGFRPNAFYPCYGMAETTLIISGGATGRQVKLKHVQASALEQNQIQSFEHFQKGSRTLVGCGQTILEQTIVVAHPTSRKQCLPGEIGEIWVAGKNVAQGYWQNEVETRNTFAAYLSDSQHGPFLRTGDLGFFDAEGELFVTGRLKEVIIIRGRNYYPQDIEQVSEKSHPSLQPNSGAAFSIEVQGQEQLVIAYEVKRSYVRKITASDVLQIARTIRRAVSDEFGLQVHHVVLLRTNSLLKTSSGKIQRHGCRKAFLNRDLKIVGHDELSTGAKSVTGGKAMSDAPIQGFDRPLGGSDSRISQLIPHTESQQQTDRLIQWLRDYSSNHINSRLIDERRCIPPYVVLDFGNQGLLGMQVPPSYGGLGLSDYDICRVAEQLGAIDVTLALFVANNAVLGTRPILGAAQSTVKEEILPLLAQGRELGAFALTEPGAGSNPRAIASTAMTTGTGQWHLQGQKIWIGNGSWAGVTSVFVQAIDEARRLLGMTGFIVRRGAPGFSQGPEALTMGVRGMVRNRLYFENVPVSADCLLGKVGEGFAVAQDAMMFGRLSLGAISLGGIKRCLQLMLRYSSRRSISTGRLLDNPVTQVQLSYLSAAAIALEALVFTVAEVLDKGGSIPKEVYSTCKILGPEFYWQATDRLVQLLGGRGFIETNLAPQMLRDARVLRIFEGPTETLTAFIGSRVLQQRQVLQQFFSQTLAVPTVAQQLQVAVDQVTEHLYSSRHFVDRRAISQWTSHCVGELANWATLLATVQYQQQRTFELQRSQRLARAAIWAKLQFEQTLQQILVGRPEVQLVDGVESLSDTIRDYAETIGSVEQTLAGEEHQLDEWLRPEFVKSQPVIQTDFGHQQYKTLAKNADVADVADVAGAVAVRNLKQDAQTLTLPETVESISNEHAQLTSSTVESFHTPIVTDNSKAITDWIKQWLSRRLNIQAESINSQASFADYGIDSVTAIELTRDLADLLHLKLNEALLWNFPTLELLAQHLYQLADGASGFESAPADHPVPFDPSEKMMVHSSQFPHEFSGESLAATITDELTQLENLLGGQLNEAI